MLSKYRLLTLCSGLILSTAVNGSESNKNLSKDSMSLRQAVSKSIEHHPALAAFSFQLQAQHAREKQAGLSASPEMSFSIEDAMGTGEFDSLESAQATLGIAWLLEGNIRDGYANIENAETQQLIAKADNKRLNIASETARLYILSMANQARFEIVTKSVEIAEKSVSEIGKRLHAGRTAKAELARAEAELARRKLELEDIHHELESVYRLLAAQWGDIKPSFTNVSGNIYTLPRPVSYESLQQAFNKNPAFIRLMSERSVKQAELKLEKSKSSSPWKFNLAVKHFESTQEQALTAGLSIPFGERSRNREGIARAQSLLSELDAKEQAVRVNYQTQLFVLYQEYNHSLHRIDSYQKEIIPRLEKALKETHRAYNLGRYSYLEWQSVQADLLNTKFELLESSVDAHLKMVEIERLTGVRIAQAQ